MRLPVPDALRALPLCFATLITAAPAQADAPKPGDGATPAFAQLLDQSRPQLPSPGHAVQSSARGDAAYSMPLEIPPALVEPTVALSYSSAAGWSDEVAYGWSLDVSLSMRRATEVAYRGEEVYRLSGSGLSAVVRATGSGFEVRSAASATIAVEPLGLDRWLVRAGDRTWVLAPADETGMLWRATSMHDVFGSRVDYAYSADRVAGGAGQRLISVQYGGADLDGDGVLDDPHLYEVTFDYEETSHVRTTGQDGYIDRRGHRLTEIEIGLADGSAALFAWTLGYDDHDGVDVLQTITREGRLTGTPAEVIASFGYAAWNADGHVTGTTGALVDLGRNLRNEVDGDVLGYVMDALADVNGDGLIDAISSGTDDPVWHVNLGEPTGFSGTTYVVEDGPPSAVRETLTLDVESEDPVLSYGLSSIADIDGDGLIDVIVAEGDWKVWYGAEDASGFTFDDSVPAVPAPGLLDARYVLDAEKMAGMAWLPDSVSQLVDVNGDRWLDALFVDDSTGVDQLLVALHSGTREGGWLVADAAPWPAGPAWPAMRQLAWDADEDQILWTQVVTDLRDMNGDGLLDVVDTRDWDATGTWEVRLATTWGWTSPSAWPAPKGYLEQTDEGRPEGRELIGTLSFAECAARGEREGYTCGPVIDGPMAFGPGMASAFPSVFYDPSALSDFMDGGTWSCEVAGEEASCTGGDYSTGEDPPDTGTGPTASGFGADSCECAIAGVPSAVLDTLLDIDGDGLSDYASPADGGWYKNLGDGFDVVLQPLPDWLPPEITTTQLFGFDVPGARVSETVTDAVTLDLDGDGLLDADIGAAPPEYGEGPRPYLLIQFLHPSGGNTDIAYVPATSQEPAGTWGAAPMPRGRWLVDVIETEEGMIDHTPETGLEGFFELRTTHAYGPVRMEGGVYLGVESQDQTTTVSAPATEWTVVQQPPYTIRTEYELDLDLPPLPTLVRLSTYGPVTPYLDVLETAVEVSAVETTYADVGNKRLVETETITEHGDIRMAAPIVTVEGYTWDVDGNLEVWTHDGGGDDPIEVHLTYAPHIDGVFHRVIRRELWGATETGTPVLHGVREWAYDDQPYGETTPLATGALTGERVAAGWVDGGEAVESSWLTWEYDRGGRGELLGALETDTGIERTYGWQRAGAVPLWMENALYRESDHVADAFGRITSVTDANGVITATVHDDYGRVVETWLTDRDGFERQETAHVYQRTTPPFYDRVDTLEDDGTVESQAWSVMDGVGTVIETIATRPDGGRHATHTLNLGTVSLASDPAPLAAVGFTMEAVRARLFGATWRERTFADVTGVIRHLERDLVLGIGLTTDAAIIERPEAGTTIETDEEGFVRQLTRDARGRLVRVDEGVGGSPDTTGLYTYNAAGALTSMVDGGGTGTHYSYDAAGRVRQVLRSTGSSVPAAWMTYDYLGSLRIGQLDADGVPATAPGAVYSAEWWHDATGRITDLLILDPLSPTGTASYSWTYDTTWVGAVASTTDPVGGTTTTYDALGHPELVTRTWTTGTTTLHAPVTHDTTWDRQGRPLTELLPSGAVVDNTYDHGWLTGRSVPGAALTYGYDLWGNLREVTTDVGVTLTTTRTTPLWPDSRMLTANGVTRGRTYTWYNNGLMASRSAPAKFTEEYVYDDQRQIAQVIDTVQGWSETYAYDSAGNVTDLVEPDDITWHADVGELNQTDSRIARDASGLTVETEQYTYDLTGRVVSIASSVAGETRYAYDGLGRLRAVLDDTNTVLRAFDRDNGGQIVRRFGGSSPDAFEHGRWSASSTGQVQEVLSPEVTWLPASAELHWQLTDIDGSGIVTEKTDSSVVGYRRLRVYGQPYLGDGVAWRQRSFHGHREEPDLGLTAAGPRHLLLKDGRWLQPEPLLFEPIAPELLLYPRGLATYRYGANAPTALADASGENPKVFIQAAGLGVMDGVSGTAQLPTYLPHVAALEGARNRLTGVDGNVFQAYDRTSPEIYAALAAEHPTAARAGWWAGTLADVGFSVIGAVGRAAPRAAGAVRGAVAGCFCFLPGQPVAVPVGWVPIESIQAGDLVISAVSVDAATAPWIRVAPGGAAPAAVVDPGEPLRYDPRTGQWESDPVLDGNGTWLRDGVVWVVRGGHSASRGEASRADVDLATSAWDRAAPHWAPASASWVLVLGADPDDGLWPLLDVGPGARVAYLGRVYETGEDADGALLLRPTGEVVARVTSTFSRTHDTVITADVELADSTPTTVTSTPEHPFYDVATRTWTRMGDLEPGARLHLATGDDATVLRTSSTPGTYVVYNFSVDQTSNYFVATGDGGGVLVHNTNCLIAAQGGTKLLTKSWGLADFAPGKLASHFEKHAAEWGAGNITVTAYLKRARSLLGSEAGDGILAFTRDNGDILRYNTRTNEFAVGAADGTIRTLFRPKDGLLYWSAQVGATP